MKRIFALLCTLLPLAGLLACTNLIVTPGASADGSTIVTYSSDDYGAYGYLFFQKGGRHEAGATRSLYHYESNNYLGEIPETDSTYQVIGLTNEHQLTILETTFGGREELYGGDGILDYGSLMQVTLQRARTAREALHTMVSLVREYGYESEGETFTIADPREVWIMDLIGKGKGVKGAVWVARRVTDGCITAHANQSRIRQFPQTKRMDKQKGYYVVGDTVMYSPDVIAFAREKGYYTGRDEDFSFSAAYAPSDFGARRYCEARVWSFFNRCGAPSMQPYLSYAEGKTNDNPMPLFVKPKHKLTLQEVKDAMRDHYEGTPFAITEGLGAGPYEMPYRPTPLSFEVDGKKYFNERPISTQQASCIYVAQLRAWLPDYVGGVLWFGNDDPNMVALVPIYCCTKNAPECFDVRTADTFTFSFKSAFWMQNWVSNMVYYRYCQLFPELKAVRDRLEADYASLQSQIESDAMALPEAEARQMLSDYTHRMSGRMMAEWMDLAQLLIVKYNDMAVKATNEDGTYKKTAGGYQQPLVRPGYPESYRRRIVEAEGERYRLPE